ncbi:hypothetical protein L598_000200001850 [Mesorhizobium sp. J18]|uniref:hypothetical protein n=1 Tax=Mesorhizobium sp. J18 TaxID=935263 RepID=UPI001198E87D|nr:hypothetical protein [Mesorhizobium sp. J18]TWG98046.1 hypothetical protein L598_000200001850 [Mesorhizobium sp. J18]
MAGLVFASFLVVLVLAPLLLVKPRHILVNPALYMMAIVGYSVFAKMVYISVFHERSPELVDRIFTLETDPSFLWMGVGMAAVAVVSYAIGYIGVAGRVPPILTGRGDAEVGIRLEGFLLVGLACVVCFVLFVLIGHHDIWDISGKRFLMDKTGATTRFERFDYYFFKASLTVLPLAGLVCFAWTRRPTDYRLLAVFAVSFLLGFYFTIFTSLRLFFVTLTLQVLLIIWLSGIRWRYMVMAAVAGAVALQAVGVTLLRGEGNSVSADTGTVLVANAGSVPAAQVDAARRGQARGFLQLLFEGRYFMDVAKMAHIGHHFPEKRPYLHGRSFLGVEVTMPERLSDVLPERNNYRGWQVPWGGPDTEPGTTVRMRVNNYLGTYIFREPRNGVTSFAGLLYADFGWIGLAAGFLLVGALHRLMFNLMTHDVTKWWIRFGAIMALPTMTLLLLNSGLISAVVRIGTDLAVIPACILAASAWAMVSSRLFRLAILPLTRRRS